MTRRLVGLALCSVFAIAQSLSSTAAPAHDKAFWRTVAADSYHVPAGASLADLAAELVDQLSSPDPEWRDTIAYTTLTSWIYQQRLVEAPALRTLAARLTGDLRQGIGSSGTDEVFRRSFSALMLSVVVARDNAVPALEVTDVRAILDAALSYLASEQDVRGYLADKGWAHSAAHTSDLIKFLARSRVVKPADQALILSAFGRKLTTTPEVFVFGEDERMARAILSVIKRADFDVDGFRAWAQASAPKFPTAAALSMKTLQAFQNVKNMLSKLEVLVATDQTPTEGESAALAAIRAVLKSAY